MSRLTPRACQLPSRLPPHERGNQMELRHETMRLRKEDNQETQIKNLMKEESHIIGSGAKRLRHGTYKCVYKDHHGTKNGCRHYGWRGEIQTINAGGCVRIRSWFKTREAACAWINGRGFNSNED